WQWDPKDRPTFKEIHFLLENMFDKSSVSEGPTPPTGRRGLSTLEETEVSLMKVNESLTRKSLRGKPGKPAPLPPRRTTSVKDVASNLAGGSLNQELKSRIRLRKAKLEQSPVVGQEQLTDSSSDNINFQQRESSSVSRTATYTPHSDSAPPVLTGLDATVGFSREDKASKSSVDNLKAAQIDRSKYLISEANARSLDKNAPDRTAHGPLAQHPKKALLPPQRAAVLPHKKLSEHSLSEVAQAEPDVAPRLGRLDITNVTKAISRYGTIPKGVRIGAYLESMERQQEGQRRDNSLLEDHQSGNNSVSVSSCPHVTGDHPIETIAAVVGRLQEGINEDSDQGIKQEPNLKPSAFMKSQSQHGIAGPDIAIPCSQAATTTNLKLQLSDLVQRHTSELSIKPSVPLELLPPSNHMVTSIAAPTYYQQPSVHQANTDPLSQQAMSLSAAHGSSRFSDANDIHRPKPSPRFSRQLVDGLSVRDQPQVPGRTQQASSNIGTDASNL
ncbi:unnamed protein product, partial [Candidula unifasciata]